MDKAHVETVVVGAGAIGLSCARALARTGREVIVLEQAEAIGTKTSARNSEVIHAGIYYPTGSLKARLCVRGKHMIYDYCAERGVPYERCGKLIVATTQMEMEAFETLAAQAEANGVGDLIRLSAEGVRKLEPEVSCTSALLSPSSGLIDTHGLMLSMQGELEDHGGMIAFNTPALSAEVTDRGFAVFTGGQTTMHLHCRELINAGGHGAIPLAHRIKGLLRKTVPKAYQAKGVYFRLAGNRPFRHLIYPAPDQASLGIHATIDLNGQTRFGPDVEWLPNTPCDQFDFQVDPARAERFYAAIRKYWPGLKDGALIPDYSGIRPKICGPDEAAADFRIDGPEVHAIEGLVNLYGIESPGLSSSLAIAEEVKTIMVRRRGGV